MSRPAVNALSLGADTAALSLCRLRGITKSYRLGAHRIPALQSIDLDVVPGELLALTGPSGSGKSTLLNVCGLIDAPDSGEYRFAGHDTGDMDERARTRLRRDAIGFVFQSFNLVPVMSIADNVEYPLLLAGVPRVDRQSRTAQILSRVGLDKLSERRPDELSGGQRQRVAIARALIKQPQLVIADEPTANLDSQTADQIVVLLRELCHLQGAACLIATHDARLLARCDRVLSLRDGALQ